MNGSGGIKGRLAPPDMASAKLEGPAQAEGSPPVVSVREAQVPGLDDGPLALHSASVGELTVRRAILTGPSGLRAGLEQLESWLVELGIVKAPDEK